MTLEMIQRMIKEFHVERDWDKFHKPKDLVLALVGEVGELAECYRWLSDDEISRIYETPEKKLKIEEEIADVLVFLLTLADKSNINIVEAVKNKIEKNRLKYPIEKMKGVHSNPIEGFKGKETN
tara:strand:- start:100 stop:471 length:372 start_codon:yes stop_codon:yes gene_type:complete